GDGARRTRPRAPRRTRARRPRRSAAPCGVDAAGPGGRPSSCGPANGARPRDRRKGRDRARPGSGRRRASAGAWRGDPPTRPPPASGGAALRVPARVADADLPDDRGPHWGETALTPGLATRAVPLADELRRVMPVLHAGFAARRRVHRVVRDDNVAHEGIRHVGVDPLEPVPPGPERAPLAHEIAIELA